MFSKRLFIILFIILIVCCLLFLANLLIGFESINFSDLFQHKNNIQNLIISYRLNKTLAVIFSGIALPISGFLMQELFKNPLADPSILGISSASSLAVAFITFLGIPHFFYNFSRLDNWILIICSFSGAIVSSLILFSLSKKIKSITTFVIIGLLISYLCSSIIGILQFYSDSESLKQYIIWGFGSFEGLTNDQIFVYFICVIIGVLISCLSVQKLIGFLLGEEYAKTLGVNVYSLKIYIIIAVALLTGSTIAMLGPIAFIGIIIPHFCRQIWTPSALWAQTFLNAFVGIAFMLSISLIITKTQLPVNILSSLIGIPTILFMILKNNLKNSSF